MDENGTIRHLSHQPIRHLMRTIVKVTDQHGGFTLSSEASHLVAFAKHDPFLWVLPGEPGGSLLFIKPEDDDIEPYDSEPPTLRCPISHD